MTVQPRLDTRIQGLDVSAYRIPTETPEADGTFSWNSTTLIVVQVKTPAGEGWGYTYADVATAVVIHHTLSKVLEHYDAMAIPTCWMAMRRATRNMGRPGVASMAIAAVDIALWDFKARFMNLPLVTLLGGAHDGVPVYGSGGFTSYSDDQLREQMEEWRDEGIPQVKMKVGQDPDRDFHRVRLARKALKPDMPLFVDANGAYTVKQAQRFAELFSECGIQWFEEPVSSDNLAGLKTIREQAPASIEIAAGEYGFEVWYFKRMLETQSVDVLQADASRCGITGFLQAGTLCEAYAIPLSAHCAPSLHLHPACAVPSLRHVEYFHDHVRIEQKLFEGAASHVNGVIYPDLSRTGHGLEFKRAEAAQFTISH